MCLGLLGTTLAGLALIAVPWLIFGNNGIEAAAMLGLWLLVALPFSTFLGGLASSVRVNPEIMHGAFWWALAPGPYAAAAVFCWLVATSNLETGSLVGALAFCWPSSVAGLYVGAHALSRYGNQPTT